MSYDVNLLTRGLVGASGLSLATRGLLFQLDVEELESTALDPNQMTDIAFVFAAGTLAPDLAVANGRLVAEHGLTTAVYLSLFTDRLAEPDDVLPANDGDRRGWWAGETGSRLWELWREKQTKATRLRAEKYVREALLWMLEDKIASEIIIASEWLRRSVLVLGMAIERPTDPNIVARLSIAWEGMS